jgi:WS/DGAT/MGAT family acyltransferase
VDIDLVRRGIAGVLHRIPRYRQRIAWIPLEGTPVWVDDEGFDLGYHVRHTSLPRPGDLNQLRQLAARVMAQRLDRARPLWEMWVVEGLEGGRFAIVTKAHHAMLDGVAGMGLLAALFSLEPQAIEAREHVSVPPPGEPTALEHAKALVQQRVSELPKVGQKLRDLMRTERERTKNAARGVARILESALHPAPPTPLNPKVVGPYRAFDGARFPLERLKAIKRALGGTINDVVLSMVTGALRRHLLANGTDLGQVRELRALVPVNIRRGAEGQGNRVAMLLARLPVGEADPRARHQAVLADTASLKQGSHQVEAVELIEEIADLGPDGLVGAVFNAALHVLPFHVVVTNVPGPQIPLFVGPARLVELYPMVPLFAHQSVGIALVSYCGELFVGLNTDADALPAPRLLLDDLRAAEEELHAAACGR